MTPPEAYMLMLDGQDSTKPNWHKLHDGELPEWKVAKSKDGQDGDAQPLKLRIEKLGTDDYGDAITSCVVVRDIALQDVRE